MCLVAGTNRVDVARLAAVMGEPAIRRATAREARELTGFSIGGIPPVGHPRPVRVVMDPDLGRYPEVWAAAGQDRAVFPVAPAALRALTNATVAESPRSRPTEPRAGATPDRGAEAPPTAGSPHPGRDGGAPPGHRRVPRRHPGALPLGRQRGRRRRVRPHRGRRRAARVRGPRRAHLRAALPRRAARRRPGGTWAARLASPIFDAPTGVAWDTAGLLVVAYGFVTYGLDARTGELRWSHRSGSPRRRGARLVAPAARHRPGRDRDVRARGGRRGPLARRALRRGRRAPSWSADASS